MICEEFDLGIDLFPRRRNDLIRSEGVHLTEIIRDIMETTGMSKTQSGGGWASKQLDMAAEVGFMWEELLSQVLKERLPCRLGEIKLDGISMSPDGVDIEDSDMFLCEYKCVWASSRHSPADNWKWMTQVKGYCKALGVARVKMFILYLNGGWDGKGPDWKGYVLTFTPLEIQENWSMIINHAKHKGWI